MPGVNTGVNNSGPSSSRARGIDQAPSLGELYKTYARAFYESNADGIKSLRGDSPSKGRQVLELTCWAAVLGESWYSSNEDQLALEIAGQAAAGSLAFYEKKSVKNILKISKIVIRLLFLIMVIAGVAKLHSKAENVIDFTGFVIGVFIALALGQEVVEKIKRRRESRRSESSLENKKLNLKELHTEFFKIEMKPQLVPDAVPSDDLSQPIIEAVGGDSPERINVNLMALRWVKEIGVERYLAMLACINYEPQSNDKISCSCDKNIIANSIALKLDENINNLRLALVVTLVLMACFVMDKYGIESSIPWIKEGALTSFAVYGLRKSLKDWHERNKTQDGAPNGTLEPISSDTPEKKHYIILSILIFALLAWGICTETKKAFRYINGGIYIATLTMIGGLYAKTPTFDSEECQQQNIRILQSNFNKNIMCVSLPFV